MRSAAPAHGSRHIPRLGWGFLACVLTLAPPPAPVAAQGVADRAPAPARFDLTLEDAPVERVLQRLAGHHGLSVVFEDGAIRAAEVTLALHQVTAIEAARAVLLATHHAFAVESDIVIVFGPEAPRRDRDAAQHDRAPGHPVVPRAPRPLARVTAPRPTPPNDRIPGFRRDDPGSLPAAKSVKPGINERFLDPNLDVTKFVDMFEGESREIFVRRGKIAGALRLQPGERVADVGAGTGLFTWMFAQKVGDQGKVYAVDISPEFVRHLGENAQEKGLDQVEVVLCSDRSAELATNSIDKAFICDTYHHFEFPAATMRSIHRALRPGGELVLVDFERIPGVSRPWILDHVRAGKEQVLDELRSFGFELVEELEIEGLEENYCLRLRRT